MMLRSGFSRGDELALLESMHNADDCMKLRGRMSEKSIAKQGADGDLQCVNKTGHIRQCLEDSLESTGIE